VDIVLVPGLWLSGATWDPVVQPLRAAGHATHPLTLPGVGDGGRDPADVTLAEHVAAVVGAIDASAGPALLVGHSIGAGIAWAAADARVARVAGLVLVGGFPTGDGEVLGEGFSTSAAVIPFPGWHAFDDAEVRDLDPGMRARMQAQMRPSPARVATGSQRLRDERRYQLPVTMVCTEFSADDVRSWVAAGATPVAELGRLDSVDWVDLDSGHWPQASCADRLAGVVLAAAERARRG
jgi:pimeloyl-ACP methyl ester carboxylesterase